MFQHFATLIELSEFNLDRCSSVSALCGLLFVGLGLLLLLSIDEGDLSIEEVVDDDSVLEDLEAFAILHDHLGQLRLVIRGEHDCRLMSWV